MTSPRKTCIVHILKGKTMGIMCKRGRFSTTITSEEMQNLTFSEIDELADKNLMNQNINIIKNMDYGII